MLDAILLPIGEGNRILAQISTGKIDELIAQTYKGDHEKMKQAVNNVAIVTAGTAEGNGAPDRSFEGRPALGSRQAGAIPGRVRRDRARREQHAGCDSAAHWRRQSHSGADLVGQDRRADRADLQGRPRKDEAGGQQRRSGAAGAAEGTGAADRCLQRGQAVRARQSRAVPRRLRGDRARRECGAGCSDRASECLREIRRPDQQGRYSAADHRHLQRRLQPDQEQPEHADCGHERHHGRRQKRSPTAT